jgi:type II secretory pathway component PulM
MSMYAYGILIGVVLVVVAWFLFIAPMEQRIHERKMELMRRKLERNEERLRETKHRAR